MQEDTLHYLPLIGGSKQTRVETDTIVISSRKRYIKYAFARGVRTIRSDAIVYKDGLLHRR